MFSCLKWLYPCCSVVSVEDQLSAAMPADVVTRHRNLRRRQKLLRQFDVPLAEVTRPDLKRFEHACSAENFGKQIVPEATKSNQALDQRLNCEIAETG